MSEPTLYRRGDLNAFGMQVVNDGEYAYPLAAEHLDALIEHGALVPVEPDYDKHYALLRQWSKSITRQEARILLNAVLGIGGDDE